MAKQAGFPQKLEIADNLGAFQDLSDDTTDFTVNTPRAEFQVAGLDKEAMERIAGLADAKFTAKGVYDPAQHRAHDVFSGLIDSGLPSDLKLTMPPGTPGSPQLVLNLFWSDFTYTRNPTGELTWSVTGDLANGIKPAWGIAA